jgi:hypothetical protein
MSSSTTPEPDPAARAPRRDRRTFTPPDVRPTLAQRCAWKLGDWTYRNGWAASLAHRVGLQGRVHARAHTLPVRERGTPLRLVFASDFHAGPLTHPAALDAACRAIAAARPDVLLLGGDFVQRRASDVDVLAERLSCITPPLGKYAVLGNHDYLGDWEHIVDRLEDAGIELLTNDNVRLPAPHDDVWLCGLDDPVWGHPDGEAALRGADGTRLVLMHAPDGLLALRDTRTAGRWRCRSACRSCSPRGSSAGASRTGCTSWGASTARACS